MPLMRKSLFSNGSIVVTILSQLVKAYNITAGDMLEFTPVKREIRIRKAEISQSQKGIR